MIKDPIFLLKLNRITRQSNCFSKVEGEIICVHMFRSAHAIETFQINGLLKAAEELGHSKISITKNNYLNKKEEEMRFNNFQYKDIIFDYEPQKNKCFIKKKRVQTPKKNNEKKRKNSIFENDKNFSSSDSISENEDDSLYNDIFKYDVIPKLKNINKEDSINASKELNE